MKLLKIISYDDLNTTWISDFYDVPLCGLCNDDGWLRYFEVEDWEADCLTYNIYVLSLNEEIKWLLNKKLFELFVGSHWSGNGTDCNRDYNLQPWKALMNIYYSFIKPLFENETPNH